MCPRNNSSTALPLTDKADLYVMGITPKMVKEAIERSGEVIDGKAVGFWLPPDNYKGDPNICQARNYLKSDWTLVAERGSLVVQEDRYNDVVCNRNNEQSTTAHSDRKVSVTTGQSFTLTHSFGVSLNASIPLGFQGGELGFTVDDTKTKVDTTSSIKTLDHSIVLDLDVPAGECRVVDSTVTQTSTDTVFRALIGVCGTVWVEIDPGLFFPNYYKGLNKIEDAFPDASAKSEIVRSRRDTAITSIINNNNNECRGSRHDLRVKSTIPRKNIGSMGALPAGVDFTGGVMVRVDFRDDHPIPVDERDAIVQALTTEVLFNIEPQGCIGSAEETSWQPDQDACEEVTFRVPFDPTRIDRSNLVQQFLRTADGISWNGPRITYFT